MILPRIHWNPSRHPYYQPSRWHLTSAHHFSAKTCASICRNPQKTTIVYEM